MSDPDVQRELEANRRRDTEQVEDDPIVDIAEEVVDPIARVIRGPDEDDEEAEESRRSLNDEEQRPDE